MFIFAEDGENALEGLICTLVLVSTTEELVKESREKSQIKQRAGGRGRWRWRLGNRRWNRFRGLVIDNLHGYFFAGLRELLTKMSIIARIISR